METLLAYIDEYGTPSLEVKKKGVTNHYIVAAIIVRQKDVESVVNTAIQVSNDYFSGSEIKSKSIGKNDVRRIKILKEFSDSSFKVVAISVDKSKIVKHGGLIYSTPFIKYIHGRLYTKLFIAHPELDVFIDEHGSEEFRSGFVKYVEQEHVQRDLFASYSISHVNSKASPIVQISDLFAGSLARVLDPKKLSNNALEILRVLQDKVIALEHWPPRMRGMRDDDIISDEIDDKIRLLSRRSAREYLERHYHSSSEDTFLRVEVLRYLLYRLDVQEAGTYVSTALILDVLEETTGSRISDLTLRTNVIAPLRDAGVLIVSGPAGYKIGDRSSDFRDFVAEVDRRVSPQLKRIALMRELVLTSTLGELDIFSDGFDHLRKASEAITMPT